MGPGAGMGAGGPGNPFATVNPGAMPPMQGGGGMGMPGQNPFATGMPAGGMGAMQGGM